MHRQISQTAPETPSAADFRSAACAQEPSSQRKVGRYLVSPLVKTSDNGWFATSVSISSGSGSAKTDRVLRLTRLFRCAKEAAAYAHAEALQWINTPRPQPLAA
jgi:hypothetical protein